MEQLIADEVTEFRIMKLKVTRKYVMERARLLAVENGIQLQAGNGWLDKFMKRHKFSLRRITNQTTLTDEKLISRGVSYMEFLGKTLKTVDPKKTMIVDETSVYFEDGRQFTVNRRGARHVIWRSTGYSSMRVTAIIAFWADGRKAIPTVIHKGRKKHRQIQHARNIHHVNQDNAWVDSNLLKNWIDVMFPLIDSSPGRCIVWDSCSAHLSKAVKAHLDARGIYQVSDSLIFCLIVCFLLWLARARLLFQAD
jgi:hypothetical protein